MRSLYSLKIVRTATTILVKLFILCGGIALSGCAQTGGIQAPIVPVMVGPEKALVFLSPGSFEGLTIVQRNYSNAVEQQTYLRTTAQTSGQNYIKVTYWGPAASQYEARERLPYVAFHQARLGAEMRAEFPSTPMTTSADYLQNDYGAFSYAVGKGVGNDLCFFGWQQIRAADKDRSVFDNAGMIQVRVRLCEAGATQSSLLALMYHYSLTGAFDASGWNPYGPPPPLGASFGNPGQPIYPIGKQVELDKPAVASAPVMKVARPSASQKTAQTHQTSIDAVAAQTTPISGTMMPQIPAPPISAARSNSSSDTMGTARNITPQGFVIPSPPCAGVKAGAACQ
jgi:hypothetical protein